MKIIRLSLLAAAVCAVPSYASDAISGGFWLNHALYNDDVSEVSYGDTNYEALILYIDKTDEKTGWQFSSEMRYGTGAFTDPANNNTGDNFAFHKAWIGKTFASGELKIGKTQVPFGWATINFWPGDELLGGYADQMDVGVKWSANTGAVHYDVAYFQADDFGDSTETLDDGGHWGSKTTYQKAHTAVVNMAYQLTAEQKLGASYQIGQLRDLTGANAERPYVGNHSAAVVYYEGQLGAWGVKAEYMQTERDLNGIGNFSGPVIKNDRKAVELTYALGDYLFYVDYTNAEANTRGNRVGSADSWAPGVSYNYGPGWFYVEYVSNDGDIGQNGEVVDGDYDALYLTMDYYF